MLNAGTPAAFGGLAACAHPRRIEFVDDRPKTLTGKIRPIELREREAGGER